MRNLLLTTLLTLGASLFAAEATPPTPPNPSNPPAAAPEKRAGTPAPVLTPLERRLAQAQIEAPTVRIKDVADIQGVRDNQLVGEGIVVGLDGTGDKAGTQTLQVLSNFIAHMGVTVPAAQLNPKNVAIVAITAQLPPFMKKGAKIDIQVSSMGDAASLQGGILIQAPLKGADGRVYAVAQGAISVGGFSANGGGDSTVQKNHTLVGRIPNGGLIEREVETTFARNGIVRIALRRGDFTTAQRMAECINTRWADSSKALDPMTIEFRLPCNPAEQATTMAVVAELEGLLFTPDLPARVVINERTGTIVAGALVRLSPTVLSHGNLYITVKRLNAVSQANPVSNGTTVVTQDTTTETVEENGRAIVLEHGPTLADLAAALNALKVKPRDIIAIFQALKEVGALNAELVIM